MHPCCNNTFMHILCGWVHCHEYISTFILIGGSRYVPGGGRGSQGKPTDSGAYDPFTGNAQRPCSLADSMQIHRYISKPKLVSWMKHALINSLGPIADISVMWLSASWCYFQQCPWDLGSAWAERAGQEEVGGCTRRVQTAWLHLGSSKATWLALGGPFLSFLA